MANEIISILQAIFAVAEVTEGTEVLGGAANAILVKNPSRPTPRKFNTREYAQAMGMRNGVIGAIDAAGITFETEFKGNGASTVPEVSPLLLVAMGAMNTDTFAATSLTGVPTSTSLPYAGGTGTYTKGNALLVETASGSGKYEMVWITSATGSTATGTITVAPALSFTPTATTWSLKGTTTYAPPANDLYTQSCSIQNYLSGGAGTSQAIKYNGCRGNAKFSARAAGDIPMFAWDFKAWAWTQITNGTRPASTFDTSKPQAALGSKFKIAGVLTDVLGVEIDIGAQVVPKVSQNATTGVYGMPVVNRKTTGKLQVHADSTSVSHFTGWTGNTQVTLSQQFGSTQFGTVGWYCPAAERNPVSYGDDKGVTTNDIGFNANIVTGQDNIYFAVG